MPSLYHAGRRLGIYIECMILQGQVQLTFDVSLKVKPDYASELCIEIISYRD